MSASSPYTNAKDYLDTHGTNVRISVPAYERMKQLYAYGYTNAQIAEMLHQEFQDIDYNPFTGTTVKILIQQNIKEMERSRMELGLRCREEIQKQTALLFQATQDVELTMVQVYVHQLRKVLDEMRDLDLSEIDPETGNYKNTSRMFVLLEFAEKFQSKIAKVCGTDALREIEAFRSKAQAKAETESKGSGLLPSAKGRVVESGQVTQFL